MNAIDLINESDLNDEELKNQYDEWLDEINEGIQIGRCKYSASRVLKQIDPIAYGCGFTDWLDSITEPWKCGKCGKTYEDGYLAEECCK